MMREEFERQAGLSDEQSETILKTLELSALQRIASRFDGVDNLVDFLDAPDECLNLSTSQIIPTAQIIPFEQVRAEKLLAREAENKAAAELAVETPCAVEVAEHPIVPDFDLVEATEVVPPTDTERARFVPHAPSKVTARPLPKATLVKAVRPMFPGSVNRPVRMAASQPRRRTSGATHKAVWLWTR